MLNALEKQMEVQIVNHDKINIDTFCTHICLWSCQVFPLLFNSVLQMPK